LDKHSDPINPEKHALGRRLKGLRESFSWTLGELSQATKHIDPDKEGVSKVSISRYENGDSFPGYREIKLIAQAFGVSITFLFYGDAPDPYAGWEFSLDEYLRSVIKDVLIEEGLIEGESRAQKENKKMKALRSLNLLREPFDPSLLDPEDLAMAEQYKKDAFDQLEQLAKQVDSDLGPKRKKK
jgi:transcriptional regulator with XRE-family HTH domain